MSQSKKLLVNWIKSQPELDYLRKLACETKIVYNKEIDEPSKRVKVFSEPNYETKKGKLKRLFEIIWVPGRNLRGKSYGDKNFDQQLNETSSIMSLSTGWDFICTFPVLYYFAKASGVLVFPISSLYALLLLAISNAAGKLAMNRTKGNNNTASFLLTVFLVLSFVKTLMSGVGIDLISRPDDIKNLAAKEFLKENGIDSEKPKQAYKDLLNSASRECSRLADEQSKLDATKRSQKSLYRELGLQMNKVPTNITKSNPKYLIDNYLMDLGACTQRDLINSFIGKENFKNGEAFLAKDNLRNSLTPISYLYLFNRNQYYNLFKGNPLSGSEENLKNYKNTFDKSGIEFNTDCLSDDKNCQGKVRWTNPGMAINQASNQFYTRVKNKDFQSLGFSFIGFIISVILSLTAVVLLYTSSINMKVRASRSNYLDAVRNKLFTDMKEDKT